MGWIEWLLRAAAVILPMLAAAAIFLFVLGICIDRFLRRIFDQ